MLRNVLFILLLPSLCICRNLKKNQRFLDDEQEADEIPNVFRNYIHRAVEEKTQEIVSKMLENIDNKYKHQISYLLDKVMHLENQNNNTGKQVKQVSNKNRKLEHRMKQLETKIKGLKSKKERFESCFCNSGGNSAENISYVIMNSSKNPTRLIYNHKTSAKTKNKSSNDRNHDTQGTKKESTFEPENLDRRFPKDKKVSTLEMNTDSAKQVANERKLDFHDKQNFGRSADVSKVAFSAQLTHIIDDPGTAQTLKFDQVITNIGNGYNHFSGAFNCPVSGAYVFYHSLEVDKDNYFYTNLMKNGVMIGHNVASGFHSNDVGSGLTIVNLEQGDTVWVETQGHTAGAVVYTSGTTFSGFLLYLLE